MSLQLFDRDFVDELLAMTWPDFLRKHGFADQQWETPAEFLRDFALDPEPEDDDPLPEQIVRTWTLRRTARHCSPQMFFIETILDCVRGASQRCVSLSEVDSTIDFIADLTTLRDAVVAAFLGRRVNASSFRAVMKVVERAVGFEDIELARRDLTKITRALLENNPKRVFRGLPPEEDEYTTLSAAETARFLRVVEDGRTERWSAPSASWEQATGQSTITLADCPLVRELRNANRRLKGRKTVLAYFFG